MSSYFEREYNRYVNWCIWKQRRPPWWKFQAVRKWREEEPK